MTSEKWVVGLYAGPDAIAADPQYLDVLQDEIGLNRIILGGYVDLPPEVRAQNPCQGTKGNLGVTLATEEKDDVPLRRAMEEAHARDIQVWGCFGGYHGGAQHTPDLMSVDLSGRPMDEFAPYPFALEQKHQVYCPCNERVNAWLETVFAQVAMGYDYDGYALTHVRHSHPAFVQQMLACGCAVCQERASDLGYDFRRMKGAMLDSLQALQNASVVTLRQAAELSFGFGDLLQWLGQDAAGVMDWFVFRAECITQNLKRFSDAVHGSIDREFAFGTDIYPPSLALLVGHRHADLGSVCDQVLPLLSHVEIHQLESLASMATMLMRWVPDLGEREALRVVYRLFGYDQFDLPESIAELHLDKVGNPCDAEAYLTEALPQIVAAEMLKTRVNLGEQVPSYPVIKGTWWPTSTVRRLIDVSREVGHNGIVLQGTDSLFDYTPKGA